MFAFYGLIACNPHFCETETEKEGRGKKNTSGGHSTGQAFIAVGAMSLE